jgi:hypothetical protein
MENILLNDDFGRSIKKLRAILPKFSFGLLIATYLISALIMGIFHVQNAPNIGFMIAAFLIPLAIQAGRGTLVFFFQLNPARIQEKYSFGLIAATALLILSLVEAIFVMYPYGISWVISVSTLMLIGWIIEIMILKETVFATQIELFRNKDNWNEVKSFYIAQKELRNFIHTYEDLNLLDDTVEIQSKQEQDDIESDGTGDSMKLLNELKSLLEGKENRPSLNGEEKGEKL